MSSFENQITALVESAESICTKAEKSHWNGEGWSPSIILGHIVDVDTEVWMPRFEMMRNAMIINAAIPQLSWWEPDAQKTSEKYSSTSLEEAKNTLRASRQSMARYLLGLSVQERSALAEHRTFGTITIESMLQVILDHDQEHRESLY